MTLFQSLLLGVVQGLTEFLPISSSGHLVLLESVLHLQIPEQDLLGFDVLLHAGTLLALLICYFSEWKVLLLSIFTGDKKNQRLLGMLALATIPGALGGLFIEDIIESYFRTTAMVGGSLLITAAALIIAERFAAHRTKHHLRVPEVLYIGMAQLCALIPGLSRSGLTIAAGRSLGVQRKEALDFSFMMAVPIIGGATVLTLRHVIDGSVVLPGAQVTFMGFASSFVVSMVSILTLRHFISRMDLRWFALYLVPLGMLLFLQR